MGRLKPRELTAEAARLNAGLFGPLGAEVRASRKRRHLTQARLAAMVGLHQSSISRAELGHGDGLSIDAWQRIARALDRTLEIRLSQDPLEEPSDAGRFVIRERVPRTVG